MTRKKGDSDYEPRYVGGKARKHHWFKNCRVLLRIALDQKLYEAERNRIKDAHREPMFDSIKELFRGRH